LPHAGAFPRPFVRATEDHTTPIATIVIVTRQAADSLRTCLQAVSRETPEAHEVIVVDNASSDDGAEIARAAGATVITCPEPEGYARAANRAVREARGTHLVFLAPEAVVARGWLKGLLDATELGVGAVGPVSNGLLGCQQVTRWVSEPASLAQADLLLAALATEAPMSIPVRYLQPLCVLVPRAELASWGNLETRLQLPQSAFMQLASQLTKSGKALRVAPRSFVSRPIGLRRATGSTAEVGLPEDAVYEYERRLRRDMEFLRTEIASSNPDRPISSQEIWGVSWTGFDDPGAATPGVPAVSIVIPVFNQLEYTRQCLHSLGQCTVRDIEVIVFDNGSTDGTREFLQTQPYVRTITSSTNLGFAPAANRGIAASNGRNVLVLNNDVVMPVSFLENLLATAEAHPECGILGPVSNNCAPLQQISSEYTDVAGLENLASTRWESMGNRVRYVPVILGFAMLVRREVIDSIGGFDERFEIGNFEDNDFSLRTALMGWKLGVAEGVFIHHYGSRTFVGEGFDYGALMKANQERFMSKWHGGNAAREAKIAADEPFSPTPDTSAARRSGEHAAEPPITPEPWPHSTEAGGTPGWIPVDAIHAARDHNRTKEETMTAMSATDPAAYKPTSGDIYLVANTRFEEGQYEEAIDLFEWAIELSPDLVLAHMGLGLSLVRAGRAEEAIAPLEHCVELDPTFSEGYNNLGVAYHLVGQSAKAREAMQRAIALDPNNLEARGNLNEVLLRETDVSESASAA
jgi:GT2 family glycosyltransferase